MKGRRGSVVFFIGNDLQNLMFFPEMTLYRTCTVSLYCTCTTGVGKLCESLVPSIDHGCNHRYPPDVEIGGDARSSFTLSIALPSEPLFLTAMITGTQAPLYCGIRETVDRCFRVRNCYKRMKYQSTFIGV